MLSPFNFAKINILMQRTLLPGCTMHYNSFLNKTFAVKCCCVNAKNLDTSSCALHWLETILLFWRHNLKSKSHIVYALWLSTIFWLCPRDNQLHQTGETNTISCKRSACSCCVEEHFLGWWSWTFYLCADMCPCEVKSDEWELMLISFFWQ